MHVECTISELEFIARNNLASGRWQPIILIGPPGWAKTSWCINVLPRIFADFLGVDVEEIGLQVQNPARRDAAELSGIALPHKDENGNYFTQFTMSPVVRAIQRTLKPHGIMVWDEIASARAPEQKACGDSLDPRSHFIGEPDMGKLPPGWIVVGTGNRAQDKADSTRLLSQITNRVKVFSIKPDIKGLGKYWREQGWNVCAIECAEAFFDKGFFADAVPAEDGPYCTPRSLEEAAHDLQAYMDSDEFTGTISPLMERVLAANIGESAARTLAQYIAQRDHVPSAADILRNPLGCKVPDQTGFQMIAANVAMGQVNDQSTATAAMHYILRLRTDLRVPLVAKLLRLSARAGWVITDPEATRFIADHHELLPLVA